MIDSMSGDFLRPKGRECMKELLKRHPDIDVLYSHNDAMTLGAITAIEDAGLVPGEDIIIITVDGEQAAIDLLRAGKINCVVECKPQIGDMVMDLAEKSSPPARRYRSLPTPRSGCLPNLTRTWTPSRPGNIEMAG